MSVREASVVLAVSLVAMAAILGGAFFPGPRIVVGGLLAVALGWAVGRATNDEIDDRGIVTATKLAMERALRKLDLDPDYLLIDALTLPPEVMPPDRQRRLIRGDQRALSIAAASILAKVARDDYMVGLDELYPEYGFVRHKGYGTREHQTNLAAHGPCRAHRHSFKPIMRWRKLL